MDREASYDIDLLKMCVTCLASVSLAMGSNVLMPTQPNRKQHIGCITGTAGKNS